MTKLNKIHNAVIIHGPGRSGTTLVNNILSLHQELCWISSYLNKYPRVSMLAYLNRLQNLKQFEILSRGKKKFPRPTEAYNYWNTMIPEFSESSDKSISERSLNQTLRKLYEVIDISGNKRLLIKLTGLSRHHFIHQVFEKPKIIWIERNPVSVISSYYKQRWGYKSDHEEFEKTSKKELLNHYANLYNKFQIDKEKLNAFEMMHVDYEDLIENKIDFMKRICDFCQLSFSDRFKDILMSWEIKNNTNTSYKKFISASEEEFILNLIKSK